MADQDRTTTRLLAVTMLCVGFVLGIIAMGIMTVSIYCVGRLPEGRPWNVQQARPNK